MSKISFFTYASSAFGALWTVLFIIALVTGISISLNPFIIYGFPFLSVVYAIVRTAPKPEELEELERLKKENDLLQAQLKTLMFYQVGEIR